jgi:hypothetical protein
MKPVGRAVERLLRGLGITDEVARARAMEAWPAVARAAFGDDAGEARAVGIDGSTLIVAVTTSAWASEIRLRERDLIGALARSAPGSGIDRIRTIAGSTGRTS